MTHDNRHEHEKDKSLEASVEAEHLVHVLNQHLTLFHDFQDAHQPIGNEFSEKIRKRDKLNRLLKMIWRGVCWR
jgi:beta-galactosidase beta subunit